MANDDIPSAPPGWYPMPGSETGERYWDGNSWSGEARGISFDKNPKTPQSAATDPPVAVSNVRAHAEVWSAVGDEPPIKGRASRKWIVVAVGAIAVLVIVAGTLLAYANRLTEVADVRGLLQEEAVSSLEGQGFIVTVQSEHSAVEPGHVYRLLPPAGTSLKQGGTVELRISLGPRDVGPTSAERAACEYLRGWTSGAVPTTRAAIPDFMSSAAQQLTFHASAVHDNEYLYRSLNELASNLALAVDAMAVGLDIPETMILDTQRWQQAAGDACTNLGL